MDHLINLTTFGPYQKWSNYQGSTCTCMYHYREKGVLPPGYFMDHWCPVYCFVDILTSKNCDCIN